MNEKKILFVLTTGRKELLVGAKILDVKVQGVRKRKTLYKLVLITSRGVFSCFIHDIDKSSEVHRYVRRVGNECEENRQQDR